MSGLFGDLDIGRKSLLAQQYALQVTSNNIANVNTPGYARQHPVFEESLALNSKIGNLGSGVDVRTVESVRDRFLEFRLNRVAESSSRDETAAAYLSQVESIFGTNESGLQEALSRFFNSFSALANDAASAPLRYSVISAAQNLAATFQGISRQLVDIRQQSDFAVTGTVAEINNLTSRIAALNQQIGGTEINGQPANSLRDQRSEALHQLSSLVDLSYFEADDGTVTVSTAGGQTLVAAGFAQTLDVQTAPPNGLVQIAAGQIDITATIKGGRLGGLLDIRDRLISGYQTDLDTLAESVISGVNAVHSAGTDLQTPPTSPALDFFNPVATVAGAARAFSVNPAVAADIRNIAAGLSGAPGDNANALAIADLANQKVLGGTQTFAEAFAALQSRIGIDTQSAKQESDTGNALLTQLKNSRDSISGVSLDEEGINLIRFQRAYQASAKFISIIDQLTDEVIKTFGGA